MKKALMHSKECRPDGSYKAVFELSPPLDGNRFVLVSAIDNAFGCETYIFPCDVEGAEDYVVTSWLELEGSFRGAQDIGRAIEGAGYTIVDTLEGKKEE